MTNLENVQAIYPQQITPWYQVKLDNKTLEYLWNAIEAGEKESICYKKNLAGNISTSFSIKDIDNLFTNNVLLRLANTYEQTHGFSSYDARNPTEGIDKDGKPLIPNGCMLSLQSFWANYQYKHEFNPAHSHGGAYSFVIWMKIPYDSNKQKEQEFLQGTSPDAVEAGNFYFEYTDMFGRIVNTQYPMSKEMEGTMLFFPAKLRHGVRPFYGCDEKRVSISGNLSFVFKY
jgi:hypothetical protein